jgi:hypothetical protein
VSIPLAGALVKYIGASNDQVRWGNNDDPRPLLTVGGVYHIAATDVHHWHTRVRLEGVIGWFNSVHFEEEPNAEQD